MNHTKRIAINFLLLTLAVCGVAQMNHMAAAEARESVSVRTDAMHERMSAEATKMILAQVAEKSRDFDRCVKSNKPFLTDHILAVSTKTDKAFVVEIGFDEALKGNHIILAYCS